MKHIYLDNAAAAPTAPQVIKAMVGATQIYGNPSAFNASGRAARDLLVTSRKQIADFLHARPDEIVFTASGSEANNLALVGFLANKKGRVITTPIEHPSVLECLRGLPDITIEYLSVDAQGFVSMAELEQKLGPDVLLVSIMYANNEIGTIEPIAKIGRLLKKHPAIFHVDACQATGFLDMNVQHLRVDLLTLNGSKIGGPRGIGALYVRRGIALTPLIRGGSQERGLRAGTENLPAIVGLAKSVQLIKPSESKKLSALREYATTKILKEIPGVLLSGPTGDQRLPNNIHISAPGLTSETLLLELDKHGISAGSGSACTSHAVEPSHVLKAIGTPETHINGALRFSLGRDTTKANLDYLVTVLKKIIPALQKRYNYSRLR